ncbi:sortase [Candidatus Gottesmanbacteria bacterium]|nr:sortase [Candidatus Gottesmanbacteria bacterium]
MKRFFSYTFITIGLLSLIFTSYLVWQRNSPRRLSFDINTYPSKNTLAVKRLPKRITIKKLGIDLPIYPATLAKGQWEASTEGVSYLSSSVIPGEVGNSILYGHNWTNLLGNLPNARPGQEIVIEFDDRSIKKFTIKYTTVVSPTDFQILDPSNDVRLTLYTCTGFFDSKRFVIVALLT